MCAYLCVGGLFAEPQMDIHSEHNTALWTLREPAADVVPSPWNHGDLCFNRWSGPGERRLLLRTSGVDIS